MNHARKLLNNIPDLSFVENSKLTAAENLVLMSMATAIICANSTFSYWAGLISSKSCHKVIPSKWFKNQDLAIDFFPSGWQILEI